MRLLLPTRRYSFPPADGPREPYALPGVRKLRPSEALRKAPGRRSRAEVEELLRLDRADLAQLKAEQLAERAIFAVA